MWTVADKIILVGIAVVFIILIMIINKLNAFVNGEAQPAAAPARATAPSAVAPVHSGIALETVAAISAAVAVCMGESAPGVPYKISSISRKVTPGTRPAWGFAGMRQNTEPF